MVSIEYLAGLFDGEGHVSAVEQKVMKRGKPYTSRTLSLFIGINEKFVLEAIGAEYGCNVTSASSVLSKYKHFRIGWYAGNAVDMAKRLAPHTMIKRAQLELVSEWPVTPRGKHIDIDDLIKQREIIAALPALRTAAYIEKDADHG